MCALDFGKLATFYAISHMADNKKQQKMGVLFGEPLIAASLALFIVVVDLTMMNVAVLTIVKK